MKILNSYIISYDLNNQKDYDSLITTIETYSHAARINKSVWFIKSNDTAKEIRDSLGELIDKDDSLFVGKLTGTAAWRNVICSNKHLKDHL
ncbi:CRISPR-associated endonuclease Cas2 [Macrococcoides canis]|uniref:CRISPR-associated endonuclease Cas2 n=1 Tax=Macrococcoides canis TaxID=1855823 RepID=UPI0021CD5F9C|nr:CRISPR-associated endonuclease Cas2 [Macrococcus canis]